MHTYKRCLGVAVWIYAWQHGRAHCKMQSLAVHVSTKNAHKTRLKPASLEAGSSKSLMLTRSASRGAAEGLPLVEHTGKFRIFSYGSNSWQQLTQRVGACEGPTAATLQDYTRIFAGYSKGWGGAVASIHPCPGQQVLGSIFELEQEQLVALDGFEGGYRREVLQFKLVQPGSTADDEVHAYVYIKRNTAFAQLPSISYLAAIKRMLEDTREPADFPVCAVSADGQIRTMGRFTVTGELVA